MGWFRDDFYSTRPAGRRHRRPHRIALPAFLAGAGWMLAVILWLSGSPWTTREAVTVSAPPAPAPYAESDLPKEERVVQAAARVYPAVVGIVGEREKGWGENDAEFGTGSGIIFRKDGNRAFVLTNDHVLQIGDRYEVAMEDGERRKANVVGRDRLSDLAVLEMSGAGIDRVAELGDSRRLRKAETAIAIGNPLGLGFAQSITVGVISSPSRTIPVSLSGTGYDWEMEVIQTDAAINHGNSGGALVNLQGEVIGINSMKVADLGVEGMGFAIPVHAAKPVLESLLEYGKVKRPYMGVYTEDLRYYVMSGEADPVQLNRPEYLEEGIVVLDTVGPARKAGLRAMDIIVALDDRDTPSMLELRKYLYGEKQIGDELKVEFYRDGKMETVTLVLEESE